MKYELCKLKNSNITNLDYSDKNKLIEKFFNLFKITNIGSIKIKNKNYIVKRELLSNSSFFTKFIYNLIDLDVSEYNFYKKYNKKIVKYKFNKNIQIPIKYNICKKFNIYLFNKIDCDLNNKFLKNINLNLFYNILQQVIIIIYFINHILGIFHNDISNVNNLRNLMINKINKQYYLKLDNYKVKVNNYQVVFIDFGLYSKKLGFKSVIFYNKQSIKYFYNFPIKSELFILFYLMILNYLKNNKKTIIIIDNMKITYKKLNFKELYLYFFNKVTLTKNNKYNLKQFDKCILDYCLKIKY